jgi:hypothetical protein
VQYESIRLYLENSTYIIVVSFIILLTLVFDINILEEHNISIFRVGYFFTEDEGSMKETLLPIYQTT